MKTRDYDPLSRRVHCFQTLIDHYWNRCRGEYLSKLHECHELTDAIPDRQIKLSKVVIEETQGGKSARWRSSL